MTPPARKRRKTLFLPDAPPATEPGAGVVTSAGDAPGLRKRVDELTARFRKAEGRAAYLEAQLTAVLKAVPAEARHAVLLAAFLAGLEQLSAADPAVARALATNTPQISPDAAAALMEDLEGGPRVAVKLAQDPALAGRLAAMSPVRQGIELGKLAEELSDASRRLKPRQPATPAELFNIAGMSPA